MLDSAMFTLSCALCFIALLQNVFTQDDLTEISTSNGIVQQEIVKKHNDPRRNVSPTASNMLKMGWNTEAAANAQRWAQTCSMNHSPDSSRRIKTSECGENLYMSTDPSTWNEVIQSWYNEVSNYKYGVGSVNGGVIDHYTQVVWYRSNKIGCAAAYCPKSPYKYFYVCHYCPAGNYVQSLLTPYKAGPPCGDCPNDCEDGLCTNPCEQFDKAGNCKVLMQLKNACENPLISSWCAASCQCGKKIY
uniref:ShKT domain-containing protein n=1 Tax=Lepisosteus oculatus TaxID=7918 RepID=W5NHR8_LEPOC